MASDLQTAARTVGELASIAGACFGTSGVRGPVTAFTPALCHAYVQSFLALAARGTRRLLIGHDLRPSSPGIAALCHHAARSAGWESCNAGVLPTPALAFAAQELGLPAVMITGSHIPFDRNGLKFYHSHGEITKAEEQAMLSASLPTSPPDAADDLPAPDPNVIGHYVRRYLDAFSAASLSGLRIGVFEHSSAARDLLHSVLCCLGAETVSLGRSDDFVAVDTEAVRPEDIASAPLWAASHALDAIVTTDGDADRPLIADERGRWLRGDVLGILCARELGARSVVTPVSSNTALEASGLFPHVLRTKIGSPHVIAGMEACADHPVVGYEANGGFLLGSDVAYRGRFLGALRTRDALLPIVLVLTAARQRGVALSALAAGLPRRHTASDRLKEIDNTLSRRLLAKMESSHEVLRALLAPDAGPILSLDRTDGLRVRFAEGAILHVRASGNAPELRCYAEAATGEEAERLCRQCLDRIARELA